MNDQKKQAINVGRKVMGQKGQGKGRKVSVLADDEPQSDYPFMSDEDSNVVEDIKPEPQSEPRRTRKVKKTHRRNEDDDSDYTVSKSASKKTKRAARRSRYEINENNEMVDTSENHNQLQPMTSSPVQNNAVNYGAQHAYAPILPAMHPYLQHNQNAFDNNQGHQYSDYSTQYNCSSGADHTSSDDLNGNGAYSSDMDAYGDIGYHGQEVSYETEYGAIPGSGY